ncbi:MurR/RpiR family transcriptional regulator [Lactococcus taiwanensis]|jgi:DNA-binding MurR/RpiR family transcriptional regulator|uniref:MurR/RpiR family transcriptional regulator n=1 Tax=Lactococcus taiwanensis TaxID=1151742 RepID=A0AA45QRA6_9LACT|nr:MurR/RpiR family transcriptional regulator [Lactococcus taiwanensis]QRZ10957.1 MurR/RpiR family transcriptional regulator [Lactococcus taiwanensis]QSE76632.1 MurR/RpiR family transcriptional regulator [Lactococcus taiwanensis]
MSNLTNAERYTWEVIQENYEKIPQISISELAELAHVSLSTVNRTVRKKGFAGYGEFRYSIREKKLPEISGFSTEVLSAIAKNEDELLQTINNISAQEVEEAVKMVDEAKEILIFARGLTINVANELLRKLQLFHKPVSLYDDPEQITYYAQFATADKLVLALSLSGENPEINIPLKTVRQQGGKIIALTTDAESELTALSDVSLIGYKSRLEVNYFDLDVHSRLPLFILERVLVDVYSIYQKEKEF